MKIRNDYVSNSSSSSFVVVGQLFTIGEIKNAMLKKLGKEKIVNLVKEYCAWISGDTFDEIYDNNNTIRDIVEAAGEDELRCFVEGEHDVDESSYAVIGIDPKLASDDDTIGSLKDKISGKLEEIGLATDRSKVKIITGCTVTLDGHTFIERCY